VQLSLCFFFFLTVKANSFIRKSEKGHNIIVANVFLGSIHPLKRETLTLEPNHS